jgi:Fe-S cluster assembly protein SufD
MEGRRVRIDGGRADANAVSDDGAVEVSRIADVLAREPGRLEPYLGALAAHDHGFVAQNTALFTDGVVVRARPGSKGVLYLEHVGHGSAPTLATPRIVVIAEAGSELWLVESFHARGEHLTSAVTEAYLGAGATLEHVRIIAGSGTQANLGTVAVEQRRDSRYTSRVFTFGGNVSRLDLRIALVEPGAECGLDGLYLVGSGDVVDHHTVIDHESPRCTSRERYKGVVDGDGVGIFDGTIVVRRGASGTEAHQENRNLLLSNDAVVHAKPHLEIDTDDVRCSHGATVGRIDPAQLFYLRSRGIDAEMARSLLTFAFAREMVLAVGRSDVREALEDLLSSRLPAGSAVKELA